MSALPAHPTPVTTTLGVADRGHGPFRSLVRPGWEGFRVGVVDAPWMLGVRAPDRGRAILVITVDGELAVAMRDAVPGGMAVVRDGRSDDGDAIAAACLPWPWMVVGSAVTLTPALASVLRNRPVLTYWLGTPPAGLPSHARCFDRPAALLDAVRRACTASVGGMRLAPGSGVELERWHAAARRHARIIDRGLPERIRTACAQLPSGLGRAGTAQHGVVSAARRRCVHDAGANSCPVAAMRANPEVLILEDDAETLDELQNHFTRKRFHPLGARSASRALSLLENNRYSSRPVLAIIDWDLGKAPDRSASSGDVLSRLARELRECPVIVYSQNIDAFNVRSQIQRSHPRALLHDKRDGDASLLERIDRMLDRTVGDLRIHDGTVVVHLPTLDQHHHREAIRLVVHHPDIVTFHSDTATKAVRRFGEWLQPTTQRCGS